MLFTRDRLSLSRKSVQSIALSTRGFAMILRSGVFERNRAELNTMHNLVVVIEEQVEE